MPLDRRMQGRGLARAGLPAAQGSIEMSPAHPRTQRSPIEQATSDVDGHYGLE